MAGLTTELFRRRIPQILGAYLIGSWAVLEFADWAVNRYLLSPYLVDFAFALLALMAPSVLLLAWFHGAPGRDSWSRVEKIGIPLNLAVAGIVLFGVFQGRDLGAATTTVVVADEEGNELERVVPKSEFRRKVALFPFDNVSADTSLGWLQHGLPLAIYHDLRQDIFFDVQHAAYFAERLREAGFTAGVDVPLSLQREIARDTHRNYFLTGAITQAEGEIVVETSLYDAARGRLVSEAAASGNDPLALADLLSLQLKRDLEIPAQHVEESTDLPVAELVTASRSAFRDYVEGFRAVVLEGDWERAIRAANNARAADPSFAYAHMLAYQVLLLGNRGLEGQEAVKAAVEHDYRLAERDGFAAKISYYHIVRRDIEKAVAVARMQTELFPDDVEGHASLAQLLAVQNDRPAAIAEYETILELDPSQYDVLQTIGGLYESMGEFESALDYYGRYVERFPDSERSFRVVGDLYRQLGEHEQARANYERALLVDPGSVESLIALGSLEHTTGRMQEAEARYEEAFEAASTSEQRAAVFEGLQEFYNWRGQVRDAIEQRARRIEALQGSTHPPVQTAVHRLLSLDLFVRAGEPAAALDSLAAIQASFEPPWDLLGSLGAVVVFSELEDDERLSEAIKALNRMITALGYEYIRTLALWTEGRLNELQGDCESGLEKYSAALELTPAQASLHTEIGRCERKLGRLAEATASLGRTLRVWPADAEALLELALVREEAGDREAALEQVNAALEVWAEADPGFEPAAEARALQTRLGG
jgi:tetratricopeptide (TPR) repeat protein